MAGFEEITRGRFSGDHRGDGRFCYNVVSNLVHVHALHATFCTASVWTTRS
jgi:hypothetical protein